MDAPSTPAPPDPVATANAQGALNRETAYTNYALSRVNQESPWGKQTWVRNTATPGGRAWDAYEKSFDPAGQPAASASPATASSGTATPSGHWENSFTGGDGGSAQTWVTDPMPGATTGTASGSRPGMPPPGVEDSWTLKTELSPAQQAMLDSQQRIGQNALNIGEAQLGRVNDALSSPLSADGLPSRVMSLPTDGPGIRYDVAPTSGQIKYSVDPTSGQIKYDAGYSGVSDLMGQAGAIQKSLNLSGLSNLPGINDFGTERQRVEDALYGRNTSRLDPQWQQAEDALRTRLANQGITVGSQAWNSEWDNFNRSKNDAYASARQDAITSGGNEQSRLFADALRGRQQGWTETLGSGEFANTAQQQAFGQLSSDRNRYTSELDRILAANNSAQAQEYGQNLSNAQLNNAAQQQEYGQNLSDMQAHNAAQNQWYNIMLSRANFENANRDAALNERSTLRNAPLNELRGLMGMGAITAPQFGQVQTPQVAAPDLMGATYNSYNGQVNAANSAAANSAGTFNGLMGLAGNGLMAYALSDRRVKTDVSRIGAADNGIPLYSYRYVFDHPSAPLRIGVMAQDVEKVMPEAVAEFGGVKAVDYGRVFGGAHA